MLCCIIMKSNVGCLFNVEIGWIAEEWSLIMKLREFLMKDAPLMLEWMHDDYVVHDMKTDFTSKTLEDCISFINAAQDTTENLHLAIVDDNDTYMGTVSLKSISNYAAEFAITVRKSAMGNGFAKHAMSAIIEKGFKELDLKNIYWFVSPQNARALRFYDKNGYMRTNRAEVQDIVGRGGETTTSGILCVRKTGTIPNKRLLACKFQNALTCTKRESRWC